MKIKSRSKNPLARRARKGFRGFPVATIAFYGPDDKRASKIAVGIITHEGAEPLIERFYSDDADLRTDLETGLEIKDLIKKHNVLSISMVDRIIGCPHEESKDYPDGGSCPQCPFW